MSRNAAALLLLVLAAGGCGSPPTVPVAESDASRAPASAPADPAIAVPGDFPLTEGMPPNESGEDIVVAGARGVGMRMLDFCGTRPLRGLELADRATAASSGPEYSSTRDLMVFADPQRASAVAAQVLDAAHGCPVEESGPDSETAHRGPGVRRRPGRRHRGPHLRDRGAGGRRRRDHRGGPRGHRPARHVVVRRVESRADPRRRHHPGAPGAGPRAGGDAGLRPCHGAHPPPARRRPSIGPDGVGGFASGHGDPGG